MINLYFNLCRVVNTYNGGSKDRATKKFSILSSCNPNGPWEKMLERTLPDTRKLEDPQPVNIYEVPRTTARYVKFQVNSWYGHGGGLQYFSVSGV